MNDLSVAVYPSPQAALPEHVVIAKGRSGFSGIEIPDKFTCQGHLLGRIASCEAI